MRGYALLAAVAVLLTYGVAGANIKKCNVKVEEEDSEATAEPAELESQPGQYEWVLKTAATIPYKCQFVYGGGYNRLLYVGRVRVQGSVIPAAIHHYSRNGTENVHYATSEGVQVSIDQPVEWLCAKGLVGWIRVADLTDKTIEKSGAIAVGYDPSSDTLKYACLVHSFYSNDYPASLGTIVDGNCEFEGKDGKIVNSGDFSFWHTLEILTSL